MPYGFDLADAASPQTPIWVQILLAILAFAGITVAALSPIWSEKVKARLAQRKERRTARHEEGTSPTPAEKIASAEEVLREWLREAKREKEKALRDVARLQKRIDALEQELYRLGWDGRLA